MSLSPEDKDKCPIHYGSRERKRAILAQMIIGAIKYSKDNDFFCVCQDLSDVKDRNNL